MLCTHCVYTLCAYVCKSAVCVVCMSCECVVPQPCMPQNWWRNMKDSTFPLPSWATVRRTNALARDFTVNALMYDPFSRLLYDYSGGVDDCRSRTLRTLISPVASFTQVRHVPCCVWKIHLHVVVLYLCCCFDVHSVSVVYIGMFHLPDSCVADPAADPAADPGCSPRPAPCSQRFACKNKVSSAHAFTGPCAHN